MVSLSTIYYGNSLQQWLIALSIILGAFVVGKIVYWIFGNVIKKLASKTKTKLDDILVDMIEEPAVFAITLVGIWYALKYLTLSAVVVSWIDKVYYVLIIFNIAWFVTRFFDSLFKEYLVPMADKSETDLDDQILPIIRKGVKIIVWIVAILVGLNNAGYDVGAVLAGLGIGGLALAFAAQDTIANIFGGVTIFSDNPFKIRDRVKVRGYDGFIQEIGVRSTKLKTLEGREVTIPNKVFSQDPVENVTREPSRKVVLNLGLTYDTTAKQMQKAMDLCRDIAEKNENVEQKILLSFNEFNDSSMNVFFAYYIKPGANILETQSQMNMAILTQFNKNKLEFAFPTRTVYNLKG